MQHSTTTPISVIGCRSLRVGFFFFTFLLYRFSLSNVIIQFTGNSKQQCLTPYGLAVKSLMRDRTS